MTFDSLTFWLFFSLAWALWRALPLGGSKSCLVVFSLFFYGWWDWRYVPLILASAIIDYGIGAALHASSDERKRRLYVSLSVVCNLGLLGFFKYTPFAARYLGSLFSVDVESSTLALWVVPVGISFFTFQTMSYTIDLYRRELTPAKSFRDFLLYVSFFPQLVAGPIVRARSFLPQLDARAPVSAMRYRYGAYRCIERLFLKVVVADGVAPAVIRAFDQAPGQLSF